MTDQHLAADSGVHLADAQLLWNYHQLGHEPRVASVAIGLGSHDLGVATHTARLYTDGWFPMMVFTGANSPTTASRFPRGEAVHYAEHAVELGVPKSAILTEPTATNTGENVTRSRALLERHGIDVRSVILVCKPYMQRRSYATCRKLWPEVDVTCASEPLSLTDYIAGIGDPDLVIDMLVGDTQRVIDYPVRGFAVTQPVPADVRDAYQRLIDAGYTRRLLS